MKIADSEQAGKAGGLTPYLSPAAVLALSFGYAVGWGSFVMPGRAFLPGAGPLGTFLGILAGAVVMGVFALNYHRMILREPGPGGAVRFARKVFGEDHGFLVGWFLFLAYIAILWANATSIVLLTRFTLGDALQFGFHYKVAGFDVYMGELLPPIAAVVACGLMCIFSKRLVARVQIVLAAFFAASVLFFFSVAVMRHQGGISSMAPAFAPDSGASPFMQFLRIFAMMPWAFVGFEAIANSSTEFTFSTKRTFQLLMISIGISAAVYLLLALLPVVAVPEGYSTWAEYMRARPGLADANGMSVFASMRKLLGEFGLSLVAAAMLAAQLTGIFGSYVATSRMMYCLARNDGLPRWFAVLSRDGDPKNAIVFIMAVSVVVPFFGCTAIGWPIDVSTFGAVLAYGYTSAAAYKAVGATAARKLFLGKLSGAAGVALSVLLAFLLLVPNYVSGATIAPESYLLLAIWCILGIVLYRREFRLDKNGRFGHSTIVWAVVIVTIFFSSLMWVRLATRGAMEGVISRFAAGETSVGRLAALIHGVDDELLDHALVEMSLLVVTLVIMMNLYSILRRREMHMAVEKTKAEDQNKAKSFFFSTVSHDIRTPLNAIIGFSQMMKLGFQTKEEHEKAVDSILVSSKTLLSLINDILDLSKLESGKMHIEPEPTSCKKLVSEIVEAFRVANKKPGLEIRGRVEEMPPLMIDPQRMRQIAFNLIGNAAKFTASGFVETRASFTPAVEGAETGTFRLEVEDSGVGISEEDQKKIASPYVQVGSKAARNGGTGLGLAICRQLARAMGGELQLKSKLGVGTTFTVVVPDVKVSEVDPDEEAARASAAIASQDGRTRRLLIADDQKMNIMVLKAMLSRIGKFDIVAVENGRLALEAVKAGPAFDMVLTDMWMPEMNGPELVAALRRESAFASLPVYLVTADVEARKMYAEQGFTGILLKPVTLEGVKALVG